VLCNKLPSPEICAEEKAVVSRWDVGVVSRLALSWFLPCWNLTVGPKRSYIPGLTRRVDLFCKNKLGGA
jgi:hypothetical protein